MDGEDRLNGINNINNWEEQCVDSVECDLNDLEEKLSVDREENDFGCLFKMRQTPLPNCSKVVEKIAL